MRFTRDVSAPLGVSDTLSSTRIKLLVALSIPATEEFVDVATNVSFAPEFPEQLREVVSSSIYDGVHNGIALAALPIPSGGVEVSISKLSLETVSIDTFNEHEALMISKEIGKIIMSVVSDLRRQSEPV